MKFIQLGSFHTAVKYRHAHELLLVKDKTEMRICQNTEI